LGAGSDISDLAPLVGCAKLKKLWILGSQVSDLAPLRGCVELRDLNISFCCRLSSLEGLQACSQLEYVNMSYGRSSLAPLLACANLKMVDIGHTRVTSVELLMACTQLEELRMYGLAEHLPGLAALRATLPQLRITR
jgi:Leucine-rich repeat (LRR) protein